MQLEEVKLSNQLEKINDHTFRECKVLKSIVMPDIVTSIGGHSSDNCPKLTNVIIPKNVTSIGIWAFASCTGLEKAEFKDKNTIPKLNFDVFIHCPCVDEGVKGLIIPSCAVLEEYQEQEDWRITEYKDDIYYRDNVQVTDDNPFTCDYLNYIDKEHRVYYTANGAVITESCTTTWTAALTKPPQRLVPSRTTLIPESEITTMKSTAAHPAIMVIHRATAVSEPQMTIKIRISVRDIPQKSGLGFF